ncbi:MAG TPA: energy transducer TonB [Prolixibacteraceae bacterium]|nr:energy transducer TonB [Prolixibacteraceae bacterium]
MNFKIAHIIVLFLLPFALFSQNDTTLFYGVNGEIGGNSEMNEFKKEVDWRSSKRVNVKTFKNTDEGWKQVFVEKVKVINDSLFEIQVKGKDFSGKINRVFNKSEQNFKFTDWQENKIKRVGFASSKIPLIFDGEVTEFFPNGNKKSESVYKSNELVSNKNWLINGNEYVENVFYSVDQKPVFRPGMQAMHNHILEVFKNSDVVLDGIDGQIVIGFVVRENGMIDGVRIENGIEWEINSLAVRAIKTLPGSWQPATLNGKKVRYYQLFPINFIHYDYDFDSLDLKGGRLYWEIN